MLGTGDSKPRSGEGERKSLGGVKESPVPPLLGVNVDRGIFIFKGVKNELLGFSLLLGDSNFKSGEIGLGLNSKDTKLEKEKRAFAQGVEQNAPNPSKLERDKKLLKQRKKRFQKYK